LKKSIVGLAVLALLLLACGTDSESPASGADNTDVDTQPVATSVPEVTLDFETCEGFLDEPGSDLVSKTQELTEPAKNDNPAIETMCQISHQNSDSSKAMTLAVLKFDSVTAADEHYDLVGGGLQGDDAVDFTEGVDGPRSFQAVVDGAGVGTFVVVQKELILISLHTAMSTGETPLFDPAELVEFAKGVTARFP
jgi:hypothetical protein